ncbi:hypothetical protein IWZ01DRAFT_478648 [Phyllosticta capitalensis]
METPKSDKSEDSSEETNTASMADSNDFDRVEKQKLSNHLSTRVIEIVVGISDKRTFYIHEGLLCYASDKFKIQLRGPFKEAQTGKIPDCEEDPELFAVFADFLYHDGWLTKRGSLFHPFEWVLVPRCYAMGERLGSKNFQRACLWKVQHSMTLETFIPNDALCQILKATTELPERTTENEDPLRSLVLWHTAGRISTLRKKPQFKELLDEHPELGYQILMWVEDNTSKTRPPGIAKPEKRFEDEVELI